MCVRATVLTHFVIEPQQNAICIHIFIEKKAPMRVGGRVLAFACDPHTHTLGVCVCVNSADYTETPRPYSPVTNECNLHCPQRPQQSLLLVCRCSRQMDRRSWSRDVAFSVGHRHHRRRRCGCRLCSCRCRSLAHRRLTMSPLSLCRWPADLIWIREKKTAALAQ